jgi:hypothetical protein
MRTSYCFLVSLFFCSLAHAMESPVKQEEELKNPITVKFMDETTDNPGNPDVNPTTGIPVKELITERDRFHLFRDRLTDFSPTVFSSTTGGPILEFYNPNNPNITYDTVIFLNKLYEAISPVDLANFQESWRQGTFFIPQSSRNFFDRYKLSLEEIYEKIGPASYLGAVPILNLLLCEYTEKILTNPLSVDDAKNVRFPKELDSLLAKILINKALMKKFVIDTKANTVPVNMAQSQRGFYSLQSVITEDTFSLCPTAGTYICTIIQRNPITENTEHVVLTYGATKGKKSVIFTQPFKNVLWTCADQQKDGFYHVIFNGHMHPTEVNQPPSFYFFLDKVQKINDGFPEGVVIPSHDISSHGIKLQTKLDLDSISDYELKQAKIIFKPGSRDFYFKIKNKIWLCHDSLQGIFTVKPVQSENIDDLWAKKYLTSTPEELGICWGIMPCSSNDFFNTCCLDPFRGSDEYCVGLQDNIGKQLGKSDWHVEQQTCSSSGPESIHYTLFRHKQDAKNHYCLTESTFKLDTYTQSLLQCMNDLYKADYNPEKPLYASAAYINRACAKNYTLSASELQKEMGALDGLVSQQVKDILFPSSKKEYMYRLIRRYIEPYKHQIKYGLGALTLGAIGYAAYKTLPKIYSSLLTMRIGYGIKGDGSGPGHRSGHSSGHNLGRSGSRPLGTK